MYQIRTQIFSHLQRILFVRTRYFVVVFVSFLDSSLIQLKYIIDAKCFFFGDWLATAPLENLRSLFICLKEITDHAVRGCSRVSELFAYFRVKSYECLSQGLVQGKFMAHTSFSPFCVWTMQNGLYNLTAPVSPKVGMAIFGIATAHEINVIDIEKFIVPQFQVCKFANYDNTRFATYSTNQLNCNKNV